MTHTYTLCPDCGTALPAPSLFTRVGTTPARFCLQCQRFWTAQILTERGASRAPAGIDQAQLPGFEDLTPTPRTRGFWE